MDITIELKQVFVDMCGDDEDFKLYRNYSGRGMYGKQCFGIVGHSETEIIAKILTSIVFNNFETESNRLELVKEFTDLLENASSDSMGYDVILYFSQASLPYDSDPETDDDDDEDDE